MAPERSRGIEFVSDPIGYLEAFGKSLLVASRLFPEDRHYVYGLMDQSSREGKVRIRRSYDRKWDCSVCRSYLKRDEADRILEGFRDRELFIGVVERDDKVIRDRIRRLTNRVNALYVILPCGPIVVFSTRSLGDRSVVVDDRERVIRRLAMHVRWLGKISSTRGFLPPQRKGKLEYWEACHPSTGRRCFHNHDTEAEARECATQTGTDLDGSPDGWGVKPRSEWSALGTVTVDVSEALKKEQERGGRKTISELVLERLEWIALRTGLDAERDFGRGFGSEPTLVFEAKDWNDPRFVMFRQLAGYKTRRSSATRQPPTGPLVWRIDGDGRVSEAK